MLGEKLEYALLGFDGAAVGDVPKFGFEHVVGTLTLPRGMHDVEGLLNACHWEELILGAIDEEHRLRTGDTGHMGIVEPTAQTWVAVGKATILGAAVLERQLLVGGDHPTDRGTGLDAIREGG